MYDDLIKYGIAFGPTILFALIVLIRVLIGYFSGARRQVIFVIHSVIAFAICLIVYFILVNNKVFDKFILDVINKFLGKDGLENLLGVNPNCKTMREVLVQYIPSQMNFFDGLELILRDNGAYLLTLVNISYHIILALVLYYVYLLLEGIMFIFYLIFYSERKHRNKKNARYEDGLEEQPYVKYRKYGATIGLFRGLVRGLICLSLLGSIFFVISGVGNKNRPKYTTSNESYNLGFTIYKEIGNYGEYGIYKVLNMCKDRDDVPYYLYAVDLVFQGGLKDEARGIDKNIYLREELNAYVEFSTDTFDLLMKYGSDELMPIILGEYDGNAMDVIIKILMNEEFQAEFKVLINNFDAKTYIVNFALSLVDSISNHLEEVSFTQGLSSDALDVMNIAFKKGYLSETIPFERDLKNSNSKNVELGYIKPSSILTENDARIVLNSIFEIITISEKYKNDKNIALKMIEGLTKYISKLSIIDEKRSDELNPVLKRLYAFVDSKYLSESAYKNVDGNSENPEVTQEFIKRQRHMEEIIYKDYQYNNIDWVKELNLLVGSIDDVLLIYSDVFIGKRDGFTATLAIFDKSNDYYERNIKLFHDLVSKLSDSKVLGEAASSILVSTNIEKSIRENIYAEFIMPKKINYANEEKDGEKYYGELYYFLTGLEKVINNDKNIDLINLISNSDDIYDDELFDLVVDLSNVLASDDEGKILAENVLSSKILHSLFSAYLLSNNNVSDDFSIYIDKSIVKDNVIDYDELVLFFKKAPEVLEFIRPVVEEETDDLETLTNLLKSDEAKRAMESIIFEGTFSCLMYNNLKDNPDVVFPEYFANKSSWVSEKDDNSEIKRLIKALNNLDEIGFDMSSLVNGDNEEMRKMIKLLDENRTNIMLDSGVLYYTISRYLRENGTSLIDNMPIIVPDVVIIDDPTRDAYRIERKSLFSFLCNAKYFIAEEGEELKAVAVMKTLLTYDDLLDNNIFSSTIAYSICSENGLIHDKVSASLPIPQKTIEYGDMTRLRENFNSTNPWKKEAKYLIYGIDDLVDIRSKSDDYDFSDIEPLIKNDIRILNRDSVHFTSTTKLDAIYKSNLLAYKITLIMRDSFKDVVSDSTLELDLNRWDIYNIQNVKGVVISVDYYSIDINSPITETEGIKIIKKEYAKRQNNESEFSSVYKSMIIRDLVGKSVDELMIIKETTQGNTSGLIRQSDKDLLVDNNNFYYQGEVDSVLYLLESLNVVENDFDNTELLISKISGQLIDSIKGEISSPIDIDELTKLYENNATGVILVNCLENPSLPLLPGGISWIDAFHNYLESVKGQRRKLSFAGAKLLLRLE